MNGSRKNACLEHKNKRNNTENLIELSRNVVSFSFESASLERNNAPFITYYKITERGVWRRHHLVRCCRVSGHAPGWWTVWQIFHFLPGEWSSAPFVWAALRAWQTWRLLRRRKSIIVRQWTDLLPPVLHPSESLQKYVYALQRKFLTHSWILWDVHSSISYTNTPSSGTTGAQKWG